MAHGEVLAGMPFTANYMNTLLDRGVYTPQLLATVTNPNLGSLGTAEGMWWRRGHWISGFALFQFFGTGVSGGDGSLHVSLPYPTDPNYTDYDIGERGSYLGIGKVRSDSNEAESEIINCIANDDFFPIHTAVLRNYGHNARLDNTDFSGGIAANDTISVNFGYFADPNELPDEPVNADEFEAHKFIRADPVRFLDSYAYYNARIEDGNQIVYMGDDGELYGFYRRSGFWISGFARFELGSESVDLGTGDSWRPTLPFPAHPTLAVASTNTGRRFIIGSGRIRDNSGGANSKIVVCGLDVGMKRMKMVPNATNSSIDRTTIAWAADDKISVRFSYPADPDALL